MPKTFWIVATTLCISTLIGCGSTAQPAPAQEAPVTQGKESSKTPVALQPDGTAANTGNLVNGPQPAGSSMHK
jgi:hypothetical protein